jgi:GT2 family glycosyltransferase/SAM-dependent methyltransferase
MIPPSLPRREFCSASLASIPGREKTLRQVVRSLLPQVDQVNVYLNGYSRIPEFLRRPKIRVVRSQDTPFGDRGDAGKMYWVDGAKGYYLSCDDDILYPPDYVKQMIAGIERHGRRAVVSFHGSILHHPFKDYITTRTSLRCLRPLRVDTPAHVLGTGVMGFHTSTLRVSREDFRAPNMADIWMGVLGQQQRVPFVGLRHKGGWLAEVGSYYRNSIFHHSHSGSGRMNTRQLQTQVCVEHLPWTLYDAKSGAATSMYAATSRELPRLVTVWIAAWGAANWVGAASSSVLEQRLPPGWQLELLIGVDNDPKTWEAAKKITDPRVGLVDMKVNRGCYVVFNTLLRFTQGSLVMSMGADDVIPPDRLARLIAEFEKDPDLGFVNSWFSEADENLQGRTLRKGPADGVWLTHRRVFRRLGGYEPWRCAADTEFVTRGRAAGFRCKVLPESLYLVRRHPQQLTSAPGTNAASALRRKLKLRIQQGQHRYQAGAPVPEIPPHPGAIRAFGGNLSDLEATMSYEEFYKEGGWDYDPQLEEQRRVLRELVAAPAEWAPGGHILEVGCGTGFHAHLLHAAGFQVTAIDGSFMGITQAKKKYPGPTFLNTFAEHYHPEGSFDGLFVRGMSWFHYDLDDKLKARCAEMFKWLTPTGRFVLQIVTDFSGTRVAGRVHNNTVEDYRRLFRGIGRVTRITDWKGKVLRIGDAGEQGVIVVVKPL